MAVHATVALTLGLAAVMLAICSVHDLSFPVWWPLVPRLDSTPSLTCGQSATGLARWLAALRAWPDAAAARTGTGLALRVAGVTATRRFRSVSRCRRWRAPVRWGEDRQRGEGGDDGDGDHRAQAARPSSWVRHHRVPGLPERARWLAVRYENGRRQQCEAATGEKLPATLEKVTERLAAGAPDLKRPGRGPQQRGRY